MPKDGLESKENYTIKANEVGHNTETILRTKLYVIRIPFKHIETKDNERTIKYLQVIWHKINIYFDFSSIIESWMNKITEKEQIVFTFITSRDDDKLRRYIIYPTHWSWSLY